MFGLVVQLLVVLQRSARGGWTTIQPSTNVIISPVQKDLILKIGYNSTPRVLVAKFYDDNGDYLPLNLDILGHKTRSVKLSKCAGENYVECPARTDGDQGIEQWRFRVQP